MNKLIPARAWREDVVIPTYLPSPPDKNPMFLEKRVYQGSSGKVYPLPFTDRIEEVKTDQVWTAVWLENEYLRVMVLPQIGGRIHTIEDKTNGYNVIYHQDVIKPALVGLAGPWISGGIEFNWPQHHRPATFLPVDFEIEECSDGAVIVWCSDHDPLSRMKGMHGICLQPGRSYIEVKVRAVNRTPYVQTFLWWANLCARVHEGYRSFLPEDVQCVADHAKRAVSAYPLCQDSYYGVNYSERADRGVPKTEEPRKYVPQTSQTSKSDSTMPHYRENDLSWYANIPVPTSYMALDSRQDYFGGYDYYAEAGVVHVANHHISPGKKQWTWGNHEFGYAWDRNLSDDEGPYIELMAGVYTDNQPDFSYLQPGETKTWSQYWYGIQKIGPVKLANLDCAINVEMSGNECKFGICATDLFQDCTITLYCGSTEIEWTATLAPSMPYVNSVKLPNWLSTDVFSITVCSDTGTELINYTPAVKFTSEQAAATEPAAPGAIVSVDELFLTGQHLTQYRHATRSPVPYWEEALRRDPEDARCNNALGLWHLRRGELSVAESHFRTAIKRLTLRNPNPYDGEPYYNLGVCLRLQADSSPAVRTDLLEQAYDSFYKATWNQAWASAAYQALAEIDCRRSAWLLALDHLDRSLKLDSDRMGARNLKAMVLERLGRSADARECLQQTITIDPLDNWTRWLTGRSVSSDVQAVLDVAHDVSHAGFDEEAISLICGLVRAAAPLKLPTQSLGCEPIVRYTLGWLTERVGRHSEASEWIAEAEKYAPDYCFPSRLEEMSILTWASLANPRDARAPFYLGCLLYDKGCHTEALSYWERSVSIDPSYSVCWRNLGLAYFNVSHDRNRAQSAYRRAVECAPYDARLVYEQDQLFKKCGAVPESRLRQLESRLDLVDTRDDLTVEMCALENLLGYPSRALQRLNARRFQPWEGGEGQALGQYVRAQVILGRLALSNFDGATAAQRFEAALNPPENLGECRHILANQSDVHYLLGEAYAQSNKTDAAQNEWQRAATFSGDFQEMRVQNYSEMTYYSALACRRLHMPEKADEMLHGLMKYAKSLQSETAQIDYFATSLPTMLIFDDDLIIKQQTAAKVLSAYAFAGLGDLSEASEIVAQVLAVDPSNVFAADIKAVIYGSGNLEGSIRPVA